MFFKQVWPKIMTSNKQTKTRHCNGGFKVFFFIIYAYNVFTDININRIYGLEILNKEQIGLKYSLVTVNNNLLDYFIQFVIAFFFMNIISNVNSPLISISCIYKLQPLTTHCLPKQNRSKYRKDLKVTIRKRTIINKNIVIVFYLNSK